MTIAWLTGASVRIHYLLLNAYSIGGGVRSLLNQASALAGAGHDVEVVSVYRRKARMAFPLDPRVTVRVLIDLRATPLRRPVHAALGRVPTRVVPPEEARYDTFSLATDLAVRRYLSGLRDGVVVSGRPGMNLLVARYGPLGVVRVGQDHLNFRRYADGLVAAFRQWYPRLDALTALTDATVRAYRRELGGSLRVERIPNMLPTASATRSRLENPTIVAAGRLARQKGFDMLIDAFAPIAYRHPEWRLRIFGGGTLLDDLTAQIARRGLTGQVRLMGRTTRLHEEMAAASMFVLSSRFEGFPMVLLEAMAHGLPVVAFDCHTGPRDILTDGWDGMLVPRRDVAALSDAMATLVADPVRRADLGANAAKTVEEYDSAHLVHRWTSLFSELGAR